jgi:hypothetical protein
MLKGNDHGEIVLIRIRTGLENLHILSTRVIVNMDWVNPSEQSEIEDQLLELLENEKTVFVLSLTRDGNKQFVYYTAIPQKVEEILEEYSKKYPELAITYALDSDPTWDFYTLYSAKGENPYNG